MKKLLTIFILYLCFSSQAGQKLLGYLPSYRNLDIKKVELLSDLIFFSVEPLKDGSLKADPALIKLLNKGKSIKSCRKFICVGGWGKSDHFKDLSKTEATRKVLIDKLVKLVKFYNLDGVDYDWEHPKNSDEEKAYELLIKETAARGIKVTMAAAGWQKFTPEVFKHLYAVNVMSYDHPKEHSTLKLAEEDINNFIKMGCPPEKINLGVPFYGRHIENRKAKSFNTMKVPDQTSDIIDGYYFNNIETLKKKVKLVKTKNLSGIMVWEIEQDNKDLLLLKSLHKSIENP